MIESLVIAAGAPAWIAAGFAAVFGAAIWLIKWAVVNPLLAIAAAIVAWVVKHLATGLLLRWLWAATRWPFVAGWRRWQMRRANVRRCARRMSDRTLSANQRARAAAIVSAAQREST